MMDALTQQLKRFVDDERAVSPVVGFVLIFALIMIVFTLYQSSVVPAQNEEVEFKHSQTVAGEMSTLNDVIQQAGTSGVPQSATIATGVQYPDRALAINPGSPAGTLETSDSPRSVTISGMSDGSGYWSAKARTFDTRLVSYQPNYNLLQQEPTYVLENGLFVKNFENGKSLLTSNGRMFSADGKRINLVLVGGEYQKSSLTSSVTVTPVSSSTEYHRLRSNGGTIEVPTSLSQDVWRNEIVDDAAAIKSVTVDKGVATLELKDRAYELRLTKVRLGTSSSPTEKYLTSKKRQIPNKTIEATVGVPETFTVSAHDKFGNAVSGADLTVKKSKTDPERAAIRPTESPLLLTNDRGELMFTYTPESTGIKTITITSDETEYDATYEFTVTDSNSGDNSETGDENNSSLKQTALSL